MNKFPQSFVQPRILMKILLLISLCLTTMPIYAEEMPRPLLIQTERFTLPQLEAYELLQANLSDSNLRQEMLKRVEAKTARLEQFLLISAKTAKLETLQLIQMKLGQRSKVEHIDELLYPTDFDPPQSPQQVTITDPVLRELLMKPKAKPSPLPAPNGGSSLTVPPAPTTFNCRNLGDTLEIDSTGHQDGSVTVAISAHKVQLISMQNYDGIEQPCIREQSLSTEVRMGVNSTILLGTMNRPLPTGAPGGVNDDRVWLAFLTLRK